MTLNNAVRARRPQINDRRAESLFLAIAFRASEGACVCRKKELARQVGISVREVNEKLRLLRSLKMICTFACKDGYLIFLKDVKLVDWQPSVVH